MILPLHPAALSPVPEKIYPLGLIGAGFVTLAEPDPAFPWRAAVATLVFRTFPCFSMPATLVRDAVEARRQRAHCQLSLLCGGREQVVDPAFWEIIADGGVLVTERTPVLEKLGLRHGENVLFVTAETVVRVCADVLAAPEKLRSLQANGALFLRQALVN